MCVCVCVSGCVLLFPYLFLSLCWFFCAAFGVCADFIFGKFFVLCLVIAHAHTRAWV